MASKVEKAKEIFMSGEKVRHTLKDVVLEHPHLDRPDTRFDEDGPYKVNAIISDDMAKDMLEIGFNVKKKDSGEHFVVCKRKQGLGRPPVAGPSGAIEPATVGNGSMANLDVTTYKVTVGGKVHLPLYLDAVNITDYVEYTGGGERESLF